MDAEGYQGWPNRETWTLAYHLDRRAAWRVRAIGLAAGKPIYEAAEALRVWIEQEAERSVLGNDAGRRTRLPDAAAWRVLVFAIGSRWRIDWSIVAIHFGAGETPRYRAVEADLAEDAEAAAKSDLDLVRDLLGVTMIALDWLSNVQRVAPTLLADARPGHHHLGHLRQRMARVIERFPLTGTRA